MAHKLSKTDQEIANRIVGIYRLTFINPGQMLRAVRALVDDIEEELGVIHKERFKLTRYEYDHMLRGREGPTVTLHRWMEPVPWEEDTEIEITVREVKHRDDRDTEVLQDQTDPA